MNKADLIRFTDEIAAEFNQAKIPHPVHLSDGNEDRLIEIFREIGKDDWALGTWRFHYQCLLKGVPAEELKQAIRSGESISLCFPEYKVLCSAIVTGILPIALGIALGIKRQGGREWVHCFLGDMAAESGMFHECSKYSRNFGLPIRWIIEDNQHSVCTPTSEAWGTERVNITQSQMIRYRYRSKYPHAGAGSRVQF